MATKVIGPTVKMPDECPTGWCDPKDGQFARPQNWGDPNQQAKSTPKTDHGGKR